MAVRIRAASGAAGRGADPRINCAEGRKWGGDRRGLALRPGVGRQDLRPEWGGGGLGPESWPQAALVEVGASGAGAAWDSGILCRSVAAGTETIELTGRGRTARGKNTGPSPLSCRDCLGRRPGSRGGSPRSVDWPCAALVEAGAPLCRVGLGLGRAWLDSRRWSRDRRIGSSRVQTSELVASSVTSGLARGIPLLEMSC
ncbi:hypothetical protein NDU88_008028 [Pleurodeles waltl]|uniref:Uncharacterized protein n=1 Tax=Pleurodeles waltl TaxID=8319 RepID=A0AAV7QRE6_PLEWA|nr:hypothetical protein NDU88_008028 [Pleurodeles waltl]